jgi:hypothetical protein
VAMVRVMIRARVSGFAGSPVFGTQGLGVSGLGISGALGVSRIHNLILVAFDPFAIVRRKPSAGVEPAANKKQMSEAPNGSDG